MCIDESLYETILIFLVKSSDTKRVKCTITFFDMLNIIFKNRDNKKTYETCEYLKLKKTPDNRQCSGAEQ